MARKYNTLGRRILAILAEGGARKFNVLRGIAASEAQLASTLIRLRDAGLIVLRHRRGGVHYALAKQKT